MSRPEDLREQAAASLLAQTARAPQLKAFVGLDGFVDEIIHVVEVRANAESYTRMPTIARLAERLAGAAGKSTNLEVVSQLTKLGGNGPIMANALASFGLKVTYLGNLGYPNLHPVFKEFATRAEVHSIAEPGHTDALEFNDGKVMVGKHSSLKDVNWTNIESRFGKDKFTRTLAASDIVAFVNWTMLPYMSGVWEAVLKDVCPALSGGPRRTLFFDLADPEKRRPADLRHALDLIVGFEKFFRVILGLNEKEAHEIAKVLDLDTSRAGARDGLCALAQALHQRLPVSTLLVHPTHYALAVNQNTVSIADGPFTPKPKITTGAGDHFNAGFCLGKLLGLEDPAALLAGVATSGYYVREARSPSVADLAQMLRAWPQN
jgi:sugar/nucleoside kinase (ribokinase family)